MPIKLSQFPLPLTPQPAMDAVDFLAAERAFQAFIGNDGELFIASRTYILGSLHALDTVSAEAISAARGKLWFAQYKQADGQSACPKSLAGRLTNSQSYPPSRGFTEGLAGLMGGFGGCPRPS